MSLVTYIHELFTPDRYVRDADHFWERYHDNIWNSDEIKKIREGRSEAEIKALESDLERITKEEFSKTAQPYFENRSYISTVARYGALGASVLGGVTAAGALFALAAGGPLTALSGLALGLTYLLGGAAANTAADAYDAVQVGKALDGRIEKDTRTGIFGYLARTAEGVWDFVSAPFRPSTYNTIGALGEGLATNAVAAYGASAIGTYFGRSLGAIGPYAQAATFGASALAFYRGRKKFDDILINRVIQRSEESFLERIVSNGVESTVRPLLSQENKNDIAQAYQLDDEIYRGVTRRKNPVAPLTYIGPRSGDQAA